MDPKENRALTPRWARAAPGLHVSLTDSWTCHRATRRTDSRCALRPTTSTAPDTQPQLNFPWSALTGVRATPGVYLLGTSVSLIRERRIKKECAFDKRSMWKTCQEEPSPGATHYCHPASSGQSLSLSSRECTVDSLVENCLKWKLPFWKFLKYYTFLWQLNQHLAVQLYFSIFFSWYLIVKIRLLRFEFIHCLWRHMNPFLFSNNL